MKDKDTGQNLVLDENQKNGEAQKEEENRVLQMVFGYYLAKEFKEKNIKLKKENFAKERLPIYFDALERGCPIFQKKLESEGFTLENQSAKKIYTLRDGKVCWEIVPKSEDPFEALKFYESNDAETAGITDVWLEPILVEQTLLEGFKQQELLYLSFDHAKKKITEVETTAQSTLRYLNPKELEENYFHDIREAQKTLENTRNSEGKDAFIKAFVTNEDPILQKTSQAADICEQILTLEGLFLKRDGRPITDGERVKQLNSLVVELVVNPESFRTASDLTDHQTTKERIEKLNDLLEKTSAKCSDKNEFKMLIAHLVQSILEEDDLKTRLKTIFSEIGISEDMGQKFLSNLLLLKLNKLPGIDQPSLYYYYKRETEPKKTREKRPHKSWDEEKADTINSFFTRNHSSPRANFRRLEPNLQKELLKGFLWKAKTEDEKNYEATIIGFLTLADVIYQTSPEGKPLLKAQLVQKSVRPQIAAHSTIEVLLEEIKNGNVIALETINNFIAKGVVQESANKYTIIEKTAVHGFSTKIGDFISEYRDQTSSQGSEDKLVDFVCLTALERSFIKGQPELSKQVAKLKGMVMDQISSFIKTAKGVVRTKRARKFTPLDVTRLYLLQQNLKELDFLQRAREIQAEKRKIYISEGQDLKEAIIGVLENSLVV